MKLFFKRKPSGKELANTECLPKECLAEAFFKGFFGETFGKERKIMLNIVIKNRKVSR